MKKARIDDAIQRYHKQYKMKLKKKQKQGEYMRDKLYHKECKMELKVKQNPLFSICI